MKKITNKKQLGYKTLKRNTQQALAFLLFFTFFNAQAQDPEFDWATRMGATGFDEGRSVAVDHLGNVYTTGGFSGTTDFDPGTNVFNLTSAGSSDIFILKLNKPLPAQTLQFDGLNDGIAIPNYPSMNEITVESWVYLNVVNGSIQTIMNNNAYNPGAIHLQSIFGRFAFSMSGNSPSDVNSITTVAPNTWNHVAYVYSSTQNYLKIYINGVLDSTTNFTVALPNPSFARTIGTWEGGRFLNGKLDEVRIWNRALTQPELIANMNCELATMQTGLVAYYKFNQGFANANNSTQTSLQDSSGNNNNGTLQNFALSGTTSNWVSGSPIENDVVVPNAPVAAAQTVCPSSTIADLAATGTNLQWYNSLSSDIPIDPNTPVVTGTYYVASVNSNACKSTKTMVDVTVSDTTPPTVITQPLTVLLDANGQVNISATQINNNSSDNCGIASYSISKTNEGTVCGFTTEGGNLILTAPSGTVFTGVQFASYGVASGSCGSYVQGTCHVANSASIVASYIIGQNSVSIPATNFVFGDPCEGTQKFLYVEAIYGSVPASTITFNCSDIGTKSVILTITDESGNVASAQTTITIQDEIASVAPSAAAQTLCSGSTVANLTATGTNLQWYDALNSTSPLAPTTSLTSGTYYVASMNSNGCESIRTAVLVTIGGITEWTSTGWSAGTPVAGVAARISAPYSGAGFSACTLEVLGTADVTIASGETLYIDGWVSVASTASLTLSNNANLVQNQAVNNVGEITVLRASSPVIRLDYVAWSAPVLNQNALAFSPNTISSRFYTYIPSGTTTASAWTSINPAITNFTPARGLMIRTPNNWSATVHTAYPGSFVGVPNNGNYNPSVEVGFNLLGNPYPSPISAAAFLSNNSSIGATTLYFWSHVIPANSSTNTYAQNNYASYTAAGGVAAAAGGAQPNGSIQIGQGFFTNATTAGTANFNNAQREGSNTGQFFRSNTSTDKHRLWLNLTSPNNLHNQIMVAYMSGASNAIDTADGKIYGNTSSVLYSVLENDNYVIQAKAVPFMDSDEVALGFKAANAGSFTITLAQFDGLFATQDIYLKDNLLNTTHNLKTTAYTFTSTEGTFNERFQVVYTPSVLSNPTDMVQDNSLMVYNDNNDIAIDWSTTQIAKVNVYDMRGRKIFSKENINATNTRIENLNTAKELVLVQVISVEGRSSTKKIIL